jgi:hypothetical protein
VTLATMIAVLALAAVDLPAPAGTADRAGNRIEAMPAAGPAPFERGEGSGRHCSADRRWCAYTTHSDQDGWTVRIGGDSSGYRPDRIVFRDPAVGADGGVRYGVWPHLVRNADGSVLIGVLRERSGGFSGGGWSRTDLVLLRVTPATAAAVLDIPVAAGATIRACFGARDRRRRRDACADQYSFRGQLTLDASNAAGPPRLRFSSLARSYPGRRSRGQDSSLAPPLRREDLVWRRSPTCSYTRLFSLDAATGRYLPDSAPPACDDYLDFP